MTSSQPPSSTPETAARLGDGVLLTSMAHPTGRGPLWLAPALCGAGLGAVIVGLCWGVAAWL